MGNSNKNVQRMVSANTVRAEGMRLLLNGGRRNGKLRWPFDSLANDTRIY